MSDERCEYCGMYLHEENGWDTHYAATCREYVFTVLRATRRELATARGEAFEEAAKVAEAWGVRMLPSDGDMFRTVAAAIRALASGEKP